MKKIVLTGGGTAGHVTPNLALLPSLKEAGYEVTYVGSYNGIERELVKKAKIRYYPISSGKFRRYFDVKNFTDPFRVVRGYAQAVRILKHIKPDVVFSKGGFVSVPVVLAAKVLHIPAIIHESDMTPGLANRIAGKGAAFFCCNFPETLQYLPKDKAVLTGSPIRAELMNGNADAAYDFLGFDRDDSRRILMIMGGSIGSVFLNQTVRSTLPRLLKDFQVVHLCGKGNLDPELSDTPGYRQFEYISDELPDLFAAADLVLSRAGANAICELIALKKPNILVPLSKNASRGDQILNARSFESQGFSLVIEEEEMSEDMLFSAVSDVMENRDTYITAMENSGQTDSIEKIMELIQKY